MQICRFYIPGLGARLGLVVDGQVSDLTASGAGHFSSMSALLQASERTLIRVLLRDANVADSQKYDFEALNQAPDSSVPHLLPPVDHQEVWAAGVTYAWSREARERESVARDVYVRVYDAERPEIFFKSLPEKVVGPNDWVGIRADSSWNVPESELTLVMNPAMIIVGFTVGNDMSSRDIEGENPLYLPQAKIYRHACAIGPVITLSEDVDGDNLMIRLQINRNNEVVFEGESSSSKMHRNLDELAGYLGRHDDFPNGAFMLTGTGIVPPDEFTLRDGDEVSIEIEGIGTLRNLVKQT